jgi:diacylglycerol kinase
MVQFSLRFGYYCWILFCISATEWLFIVAIGFVMSIEGLNTAVNRVYSPYHENWFHKETLRRGCFLQL